MTAFETWLSGSGGTLVYGGEREFSTAASTYRLWVYGPISLPIQVGLIRLGDHNIVALRYPMVAPLPTNQFEQFLKKILACGVSVDQAYTSSKSRLGMIINASE